MHSILKYIRIIVAVIFLALITLIFIDFRGVFTSGQINAILFLQFLPSLMKFMHIAGLATAGYLIILLITALFGRAYCSFICPFGIYQDVVSFLSKKLRKKKKIYRFSNPWNKTRYGILALSLLAFIAGGMIVVYLLDPYSNFGRISTDLLKPIVLSVNNLSAKLLEKLNVYFLYPVDIKGFHYTTLIFPITMLVFVSLLAFRRGRLYCNTVCPVGSLLGLLSKISLFKIKIDEHTCTRCGKCSSVCKSECINIKDQTVDFSRCVACYNCIKICPEQSINYTLAVPKRKVETEPEPEPTDNNRRDFMAKSLLYMMGLTAISKVAMGNASGPNSLKIQKQHPVCPPGSISLEHFNHDCTACHLCVSACPTKVLQPSFLEYGISGMMQPRMDYKTSFCNFECTLCGEVCPTGAIRRLLKEEKTQTQIGKVHFLRDNCIVFTDHTSCGACSEHCPTKAVNMVPFHGDLKIPSTNTDICIGCGACEYACPASPNKAIFVEGNTIHQKAQKPKIEELKPAADTKDFPF
jgi:ferredoxin